jgi:hypothetical protein
MAPLEDRCRALGDNQFSSIPGGIPVNLPYEDGFVVYARQPHRPFDRPDVSELPLSLCPTYEDALRLRHALNGSPHDFVIRFVGTAGGGD